jgi:hypothetical protein
MKLSTEKAVQSVKQNILKGHFNKDIQDELSLDISIISGNYKTLGKSLYHNQIAGLLSCVLLLLNNYYILFLDRNKT